MTMQTIPIGQWGMILNFLHNNGVTFRVTI